MSDDPRELCTKCGSVRHTTDHCDAMPALTDEPRKPFCEWCDAYHPVGQHEARGRALSAVLAEVAHLESIEGTGEAIFVIGQYENAIVDAALALRKAMRLKAGGAT